MADLKFHVKLRKDRMEKYLDLKANMDLFGAAKKLLKLQVPKNVLQLFNERTNKLVPEGTYKEWGPHLAPGDVLRPMVKRFELGPFICTGEELGSGAFSQVYKGYHSKTQQLVAIKVVDKELLSQPKEREYHERETKIIAQLQHDNIVKLYQLLDEDTNEGKFLYIVMEFCLGGGLDRYLRNGQAFSREHCRRFIGQMAQGLAYLHEQHITHRDLKTSNVLLTSTNLDVAVAKLCDFGFARFYSEDELVNSHPMTPLFADKLVLERKPLQGSEVRLADLFSLGLIAYNLAAGKLLWDGIQTPEQLHEAHKSPEKRLRANLQLSNDPECFDLISRLLRIGQPFTSFEELLEHPFLSAKQVIVVSTGEQFRLPKGNRATVALLKQTLESNKLAIPAEHQILLSPLGEEIFPGAQLPFTGYLLSDRKEDYHSLLEAVQPAILDYQIPAQENIAPDDLIFKDLLNLRYKFQVLHRRLKTILETYYYAWTAYSQGINFLKIQREGYKALTENVLNSFKELQDELKFVNTVLTERKPRIDKIFHQFAPCLERLKSTPLDPVLAKPERKMLIDCINEEKTRHQFQNFKLYYESCVTWCEIFDQLKKKIEVPNDPSLAFNLASLEWKGQMIESFALMAQQSEEKVAQELYKARQTVRSGNTRINSYTECFQEIIDKLEANVDQCTEEMAELNKALVGLKSQDGMVKHLQHAASLKSDLTAFQKQSQTSREDWSTFTKLFEELEHVLELPEAYQQYVDEMQRRFSFHKQWDQRIADTTSHFSRLSSAEQETRRSFKTKMVSILNPKFFPATDSIEVPSLNLNVSPVSLPPIVSTARQTAFNEEEDFFLVVQEDPAELKKENEKLRGDYQDLLRKYEDLSRGNSSYPSETISRLTENLNAARRSLNQYEEQFKALQREKEEKEKVQNVAPVQNNSSQEAALRAQLQDTTRKLQDTTKKLQETEETLRMINHRNASMTQESQRIQRDRDQFKAERDQFKTKHDALRHENLDLEAKLAEAKQKLASLNTIVTEQRSKDEELQFYKNRSEKLEKLLSADSKVMPCPICNEIFASLQEQTQHLASHPELN